MHRIPMRMIMLIIIALLIFTVACSTPPSPTPVPTAVPTSVPPTVAPTIAPTATATKAATIAPTTAPTVAPTIAPSATATIAPTKPPTVASTLTTTAPASSASSGGTGLAQILPPGPGVSLMLANCGACHTTLCAVVGQRDATHWQGIKISHRDRVASMSDADYETLLTYLSTNFDDKKPEPNLSPEQKQNSSCSAGY